ncbi:MAG: hypothetical protein RLZZ244_2203, partial [Verrucomicrobiota bacterium]
MSAFQKIVRVGRSVLGGAALGLCWGSATLGLGPEWTWAVELPEARLRVLNPPGGRPGETVVVEVQGVDLEEGTLRFTHPGIESAADAKDPKKMAVKIGEGVPEGVYEARVVGRYGVSNSRRFEVSRLATTPLDPKAIAMEQAQAWSLPGVIQGAVPSQSVCWFRVEAQAGRELVFDCRAAAMDSKLDPVLVLSDAGGRELVRVRDRVLRFTPKDSGPLFLSLRDFLSGGGPEFFFRLVGGSASEVAVRPVETPLVFWPVSGAARKEQEPNDERKPERVSLPLEVRGEFGPGRDVDGYEFEGKKGEVWWLEVTSNRLGYASDPRLVVQRVMRDKDGKETLQDVLEARKASLFEGDPDFNGENRDPVGRLEVKEDGVFRATLRDGYAGSAGGEARPYTLAIRKPAPDFALVCAAHPPMANRAYLKAPGINPAFMVDVRGVNLRPGQGVPVRVLLVRRDGFEGEVRVEAEGLPAGVTAEPCVVGPGKKEGILVLRAGREAKRWSGAIRIYGMASVEGQERRREAVGSTPLWDSEMYPKGDWIRNARCRPMGEFTLGVMEDAPWTTALRVEPAQLEALPTDKVSLTVHADRDGVEGGALKLRVVGFEGLEKAAEVVLADKAASVAYPWDLAPLKLAPGRYTVWFQGDEKAKREVRGKPGEVDLKLASNAVTLVIRDPAAKPAASVPAPALAPVSFVKEILPMLEASCLPCHNATKAEGGLVLETPQAMREGGDSGPAIVPNKALSSLLYETAAHQKKPFMPPNANKAKAAPWTEAQLALVKRWIDEGATGTGKLRQPVAWKPMPEAVRALSAAAVDAQGRWVAAGQGGRVFFYDVALRRPAGFVEAHPDVVSSAAFSPDGSMLATGSRGEVKLWKNGSGGVPAFPLEGVVGVAVSGSGSVASGTLRHSDGQTVVVAMHGQPTRIKRPGKVPEVVELGGTPEGVQAKALVAERMAGARCEVQFLEAEGKGLSDKLAKAKTDWEKLRKEHESLELKKGDREKA